MQKIEGLGSQIFATIVANFLAIADGLSVGWTSPTIPYFLSHESHIKMTEKEAELIETFLMIGALVGLPVSKVLVDRLGRKYAIMVACFFMSLCWILIAIADRVLFIYIARFGMGLGLNMAYIAMPMYIGEISDKRVRGFLSSSTFIFILLGIIMVYSLGPFVPYIITPIIGALLLLCEVVLFFFLPESPLHLVTSRKYEEAKQALQKFRGSANIDVELDEMKTVSEKSQSEGMHIRELFTVSNNRRGLIIMAVLNASQCFGCYEIIVMNLQEILENAESMYLDASIAAIVVSAVMMVASGASSVLVDRFGRKILLVISSIGTALSILSLAVYLNVKNLGYETSNISWMPLASIIFYGITFKLGLGTVCIVIASEIYPQKMKTLGMTIGGAFYIFASIISLQFFFALKTFGMHVPFYVFSVWVFLIVPFIILIIPETKGKSMNEIQELLRQQKYL